MFADYIGLMFCPLTQSTCSRYSIYILKWSFLSYSFFAFVSFFIFLIHIINSIFLFNFRFEETLISYRKNAKIAIVDCLILVFVYIFSSIMFFIFSITFFKFLIIFFIFIIYFSKYLFIIFITFVHSWRVMYFIKLKNFIIIVHDIIFDRFFYFPL